MYKNEKVNFCIHINVWGNIYFMWNSTKSSTTNEDSIDTAYVDTFNVDTTLMDSSTQVNPQLGKAHLNIIRTLR